MRRAGLLSAGFHLLILLLSVFGLPIFNRELALPPEALPVELAPISELTNIPQKPQKREEPKEEPKEVPKPPPPPEPQPAPEPEAEPVPPPPDEKPKAEVKPEPPKPPERVVKVDGPKPKKKPKKKPEEKFDVSRIAALLDKKENTPKPDEENLELTEQPPTPVKPSLSDQMTLSEIDSIRVQIEQCWIVPSGARYAENLVVRIRIFLQADGSLARPPEIVDSSRMSMPGEENYRTAAESALRAIHKCEPFQNLPPDKYENWREIELNFDPRNMLGG